MNPNSSAIRRAVLLVTVITSVTGPAAMAAARVCDLITATEASAALGVSVAAGTAVLGESGDQLCQYVDPRYGMLAITLADNHGREKYEKAKSKIQKDAAITPENISGVGDEAVFANVSKGVSELLVVKGDKSIAIALGGRAVNSSKEALKDLARKALSRL